MVPAFAEIEYGSGKLRISGVIGPKSNDDCLGSCGQCVDEISAGTPADCWTSEMLEKFCAIWRKWHLNDMHAECEHQQELGYNELAKKVVTIYEFTLTSEAYHKKKGAEKTALEALREGKTFTPTPEQLKYASLPTFVKSHLPDIGYNYKIYKTEEKTLGWLSPEVHPEGILGKECPVCGYKYGSSWLYEDVPNDVIDWLFNLPDTKIKPAWV